MNISIASIPSGMGLTEAGHAKFDNNEQLTSDDLAPIELAPIEHVPQAAPEAAPLPDPEPAPIEEPAPGLSPTMRRAMELGYRPLPPRPPRFG